jgi:SET domain-containing protein
MSAARVKPTRSPYIVQKRSAIHGRGIYARREIPKGTRIIEYVGERITKAEAERRGPSLEELAKLKPDQGGVYIFELNKRHDIDGNVPYNTARYINHSCDPNCEIEIIRGHIWVVAMRDIRKDEELSYNYGYDIDCYQEHPCRCGSNRCVGYIVDEDAWPRLKKILQRKASVN